LRLVKAHGTDKNGEAVEIKGGFEAITRLIAEGGDLEAVKRALAAAIAAKPKTLRNSKNEIHLAKTRRAAAFASIRTERDANAEAEDMIQVAQALILCGLPYEKTNETRITKSARLADGSIVSVTFSAVVEGGVMPYGSDRSLLHFLFDRAVKSGSRFISWETATEFLKAMGISDGGKNYHDLRQRFDRIRGLVIAVKREGLAGTKTEITPVIRRSHLPTSVDIHAAEQGQNLLPIDGTVVFGVELDEQFFADLKAHHVPVPTAIIRTTRNKSQLQDNMVWLYWRCYAAKKPSLIPWEHLRLQLWQDDKTARRIKVRFAEAIAALKTLWPELQAEALKAGLMVAPPLRGRYMLPQGAEARKMDS
jgi:hypothetical protein